MGKVIVLSDAIKAMCPILSKTYSTEELQELMEIEQEQTKLQHILGKQTFERVRKIVEQQPSYKRAAFYETACRAAMAGYDYSAVESISDMGSIFAKYFCNSFMR